MTSDAVDTRGSSEGEPRAEKLGQRVEDDADAVYEVDEIADNKPKKKRKLVKNGDKKYQCPEGGCGKSYSRAEHLYRHQLNRERIRAIRTGRRAC